MFLLSFKCHHLLLLFLLHVKTLLVQNSYAQRIQTIFLSTTGFQYVLEENKPTSSSVLVFLNPKTIYLYNAGTPGL